MLTATDCFLDRCWSLKFIIVVKCAHPIQRKNHFTVTNLYTHSNSRFRLSSAAPLAVFLREYTLSIYRRWCRTKALTAFFLVRWRRRPSFILECPYREIILLFFFRCFKYSNKKILTFLHILILNRWWFPVGWLDFTWFGG